MDTKKLKKSLLAADRWIRLLFMILFAVVNYFVQCLILVIALVQFIIALITGKCNSNLAKFSEGLSVYAFHIAKYLMFVTEEKPFPFSSWPGEGHK
jgi:hypothetical protein